VCARLIIVALIALLLWGCGREAGWYPVPGQLSLDSGFEPGGVGPAVKMTDADSSDYIVSDIDRMPGAWRWTFLHPELRFRVANTQGLHFTAQINIAEQTFQVTGPVVVTYSIDGKRLGSTRCDHPGTYEIDEPVPVGWLETGRYLHVTFDADKHWVSPGDGAQLSFLLSQAGFQQ
jgi:hypothetical protein